MKRFAFLFVSAMFLAGRAEAFTQEESKVALHLSVHSAKFPCVPAEEGGGAPADVPCSRFATAGEVGVAYAAYLIAVGGETGFTGLSCGLEYDGTDGRGVDVFGWTLCADTNVRQPGPQGPWPAPGSGNLILWFPSACATRTVPGFEGEGVHAIAGALYVYAYGPDVLTASFNRATPPDPEIEVVDCSVIPSVLPPSALGRVAFSQGATEEGCNPCLGPCAPDPACAVSPLRLDFGTVDLFRSKVLEVKVENVSGDLLLGLVQVETCAFGLFFTVLEPPRFTLEQGEKGVFRVRYLPQSNGQHACVLDMGPLCADIELVGRTTGSVPVERTSWGRLKARSDP